MITDRPNFPEGYGIPQTLEGLLPWGYVVERMEQAINYWVATVARNGSPHVTPVWGAWVESQFYFDGSPETRRGKNILANPRTAVHLEDGTRAVIVHGLCRFAPPAPEVKIRLSAQYNAKYAALGYAPTPESWDGGIFILTPTRALAWTDFPRDVTRWRF